MLNTLPPPDSLKEAVRDLLFSMRVPKEETLTSSDLRVILYFLSQQSVHLEGAGDKLREKILIMSQSFSGKVLDKETKQQCALTLMESFNTIASVAATSAARAEGFAQGINALLEAWPGSIEPLWAAISRFFSRVPTAIAIPLWPLVLELRSKASEAPQELKRVKQSTEDS